MNAIVDLSLNYIFGVRAPLWLELLFVVSFGLGFIFLRVELFRGRSKASAARKLAALQIQLRKTVAVEVAAGQMTAAIKAWNAVKARAPTQLETLKLIVQAISEVEPEALVKQIEEHVADHSEVLCNSQTAVAVLEVLSRTGQVTLMEELHRLFSERFQIPASAQIYEVLLSGYASVGDGKQVDRIMAEIRAAPVKASARGYSLTIRGFLKHGFLDAALEQMLEMQQADFDVPWIAITQLVRAACELGRGMEIFDSIENELPIPPEATVLLLEDCLKRGDLPQARHVERAAREQKGSSPLLIGAYDALLKTCVLHSDLYALELFEEMQKLNMRISEGLCVGLLARCAETKFLRFAEEIAKVVRSRDGMTIAVYSALMKVYAYAGMHSKACDLYDQIVAEGLEPDAMMYGCLMKFAVECGRTDLSRQLFSKAPNLDIQNYMSLIKAAGRDKDIGQAFGVLQKLKESGVTPDVAAYSSVLDVCVSAGDLSRARELMDEMRHIGKLDTISYNTFLKGLCFMGNIRAAKELLSEMERMNMPPNDVSFNCLINASVSRGMWQEAWNTVDMMERSGVQVDNYTVSIMLKSLKKDKDSRDVGRALALLDRSGLNVCSDEVLLNTVLETCIRHREYRRLENIINAFSKSSIQPSVHIYGGLIKACSTLKRLDKCWEFWHIMVSDRGMDPNDVVLGCMLDALVCNKRTEEAVVLFKKWQPKVPANTIIYSTLIKGFANSRQASRAMDMWREMLDMKMPMNNMVYNAVIDAQARVGAMDDVGLLVKSMAPHGCTPDSITYSTIVKGYCFRGDLDKAFEVLRDMQQNQMATDSVIYNTLLDGCVRNNRMDLADTLLEDMERFRITPSNVTLGIMVKMYGRRKQLGKAFHVVEEIPKKHGFKANAQVKTCLMSACFYNHDVDLALKVFEELRDSDQGADWKIYASMISGTLRHGRLEQAVAVVEDAYGLNPGAKTAALSPGQGLETESLEQVLRAIEERGQMESMGVPLIRRLRAARIPICGKLLSTFTTSAQVFNVHN
mmetsp:Transcript_52524/g.96773  ORF Transcript_52524/g.96773 Transcript_52524/m.96773 type:complete len:1027 (+) Transcript_52524:134-3214(+)